MDVDHIDTYPVGAESAVLTTSHCICFRNFWNHVPAPPPPPMSLPRHGSHWYLNEVHIEGQLLALGLRFRISMASHGRAAIIVGSGVRIH